MATKHATAITLEQFLAKLPVHERARIARRSAELVAEETTLHQRRDA